MLRLGKCLAVTATIVRENGASARELDLGLNLEHELLSNDAWLRYGHREGVNQASVSKNSPLAKNPSCPKLCDAQQGTVTFPTVHHWKSS